MNAVKKLFVLTSAMAALSASGFAVANSPATGEFYVTINITPTCTVQTNTGNMPTKETTNPAGADIDFGDHVSSKKTEVQGSSKAASNGIVVQCTRGTPYTIKLTPSNNNTSGAGEMSGVNGTPSGTGGEKIAYTLYQDSNYSKPWGNQKGGNAVESVGTGTTSPNYHPVYGKVAGDQFDKTIGRYFDRVGVEVAY